uniref:MARVEL domain-containing protein n=1 Tax=Angiostrongylus cantonensis TaxID=6313 RepID=A0A0K0D9M4_ANGCA
MIQVALWLYCIIAVFMTLSRLKVDKLTNTIRNERSFFSVVVDSVADVVAAACAAVAAVGSALDRLATAVRFALLPPTQSPLNRAGHTDRLTTSVAGLP